jgi:excinuclease ABC subunit B
MKFTLKYPFKPAGDQPQAIEKLTYGVEHGMKDQVLLGATGTGKTFTISCVVEKIQKPTLVIAHNKTLAAQLASEFREFFPQNSVQYFVSYYDYYQPEAYIPRTDTYIEKDSQINEEIEKYRNSATQALLTRQDVLIVASVSCIYGLGNPEDYRSLARTIKVKESYQRSKLLIHLSDLQYVRNDFEFKRGTYRLKGDTLDVFPSYEDRAVRIEYFGDTVERILLIDPLTGEVIEKPLEITIFPAKHFVTNNEKMKDAYQGIEEELAAREKQLADEGKEIERYRIHQKTTFDLEMMQETGFCSGIENYSRHIDGRAPGTPPSTLLDYFPDDYLLVIDESHMTIPQIRGMYNGDRARKETLVNYGFRLPSALDNRPLRYEEFRDRVHQAIYVSATPNDYEKGLAGEAASGSNLDTKFYPANGIIEQIIRPTGILDPVIEIRSPERQIDDLIREIEIRIAKHQRVIVTTLTKRMAEELTEYLLGLGVKVSYIHSDVETIERTEILTNLRLGLFDVIVGINLLREGIDLPEVSLVAILDADKEGFLRSDRSLIQTIGRAARHIEGKVIMYADHITGSMQRAIEETNRRRAIQEIYNAEYGMTPTALNKEIKIVLKRSEKEEESSNDKVDMSTMNKDDIIKQIGQMQDEMEEYAKNMQFEQAASLRDRIRELNMVLSTLN